MIGENMMNELNSPYIALYGNLMGKILINCSELSKFPVRQIFMLYGNIHRRQKYIHTPAHAYTCTQKFNCLEYFLLLA